jgi:hypothetical protein
MFVQAHDHFFNLLLPCALASVCRSMKGAALSVVPLEEFEKRAGHDAATYSTLVNEQSVRARFRSELLVVIVPRARACGAAVNLLPLVQELMEAGLQQRRARPVEVLCVERNLVV